MSEPKSELEVSLLADKEDIALELHFEWLSMKSSFKRDELEAEDDNAGIDIRLAVEDGSWEILTGDSQFDTFQGDYCASGFLDYDWEESEAEELCNTLAKELIESIVEEEAWS